MSQNGKYYPDTVLKSGDEIQISFAFQGEKEISGIVKKVEVIANALVAVVEVSGRKYKTLSGEPLEYVLIKYPGEIFYFLVSIVQGVFSMIQKSKPSDQFSM